MATDNTFGPYAIARRFMRQRNTTVSDPDFIVAYLLEEARRANVDPYQLAPLTLQERLARSLREFTAALAEIAKPLCSARAAFERLGRGLGDQSDYVKAN